VLVVYSPPLGPLQAIHSPDLSLNWLRFITSDMHSVREKSQVQGLATVANSVHPVFVICLLSLKVASARYWAG